MGKEIPTFLVLMETENGRFWLRLRTGILLSIQSMTLGCFPYATSETRFFFNEKIRLLGRGGPHFL